MGRRARADLEEALRRSARHTNLLHVSARRSDAGRSNDLRTRFGGAPCIEAGTWPFWRGSRRPYDFVCQVDFHECDASPDISVDLMAIFICWKAAEEGHEDACLVRAPVGPVEACLERPVAVEGSDYRVRPCTVAIQSRPTYPHWFDATPDIQRAASRLSNPRKEFERAKRKIQAAEPERSRVGGYPNWVHEKAFRGQGLTFVAQIEYEPDAGNCIGDAAPIFIAATPEIPSRLYADYWQSH